MRISTQSAQRDKHFILGWVTDVSPQYHSTVSDNGITDNGMDEASRSSQQCQRHQHS